MARRYTEMVWPRREGSGTTARARSQGAGLLEPLPRGFAAGRGGSADGRARDDLDFEIVILKIGPIEPTSMHVGRRRRRSASGSGREVGGGAGRPLHCAVAPKGPLHHQQPQNRTQKKLSGNETVSKRDCKKMMFPPAFHEIFRSFQTHGKVRFETPHMYHSNQWSFKVQSAFLMLRSCFFRSLYSQSEPSYYFCSVDEGRLSQLNLCFLLA